MGLIGMISAIFQIGVVAKGDLDDQHIRNASKNRALKNNTHTYIDGKGRMYDSKTDVRVYVTTDNRDNIIREAKTGKMLYNISAEQRFQKTETNKREAIAKGKRFYFDTTKKLYCELSTGKYYRRYCNYQMPFNTIYRDVENDRKGVYEFGEGPTDEEIEFRRKLYEKYKDISNSSNNVSQRQAIENQISSFDREMKKKYSKRMINERK